MLKDTTVFVTFTTQLNRDLTKKDKVQQRKGKKYSRDVTDFKTDRTFKWQSQVGQRDPISTYSTLEKTARVHPQHDEQNYGTQYGPHQEHHRT